MYKIVSYYDGDRVRIIDKTENKKEAEKLRDMYQNKYLEKHQKEDDFNSCPWDIRIEECVKEETEMHRDIDDTHVVFDGKDGTYHMYRNGRKLHDNRHPDGKDAAIKSLKELGYKVIKEEALYPKVKLQLVGRDGNAFSILGRVREEMRKAHILDKWDEFYKEATSGDYSNLLATCAKWFSIK